MPDADLTDALNGLAMVAPLDASALILRALRNWNAIAGSDRGLDEDALISLALWIEADFTHEGWLCHEISNGEALVFRSSELVEFVTRLCHRVAMDDAFRSALVDSAPKAR